MSTAKLKFLKLKKKNCDQEDVFFFFFFNIQEWSCRTVSCIDKYCGGLACIPDGGGRMLAVREIRGKCLYVYAVRRNGSIICLCIGEMCCLFFLFTFNKHFFDKKKKHTGVT